MFHKSIQYALEKLGKSKSGFETTVVSKFKRKRRVGSGNELVDYSRAPCLGADQKARGLWERDCGLPVTLRMLRVKSDKSDWFWSQSIVFTDPFKTGMSLHWARGRDSWC